MPSRACAASLPDDVDEPQVVKSDADSDPVMRLAVTSSAHDAGRDHRLRGPLVADRLATVDGVASIDLYGDRPFAVRIWLDRRALAARNLTVADVDECAAGGPTWSCPRERSNRTRVS